MSRPQERSVRDTVRGERWQAQLRGRQALGWSEPRQKQRPLKTRARPASSESRLAARLNASPSSSPSSSPSFRGSRSSSLTLTTARRLLTSGVQTRRRAKRRGGRSKLSARADWRRFGRERKRKGPRGFWVISRVYCSKAGRKDAGSRTQEASGRAGRLAGEGEKRAARYGVTRAKKSSRARRRGWLRVQGRRQSDGLRYVLKSCERQLHYRYVCS